MEAVTTLAEIPCPDMGCGCHHYPELKAKHMVKTTCHGTGSLIPGLWKKCDAPDPSWDSSTDTIVYGHRDVCQCRGRSQILIPLAEQRQVMEDWAVSQGYKIKYYGANVVVERHNQRYSGNYKKFQLPDNEALADAIYQAIMLEKRQS